MSTRRSGGRTAGRPHPAGRGGRPAPRRVARRDPESAEVKSSARDQSAPALPQGITGRELGPQVLAQLRTLPARTGQYVAAHLAAAGDLLGEDPEQAFRHATAARARASRVAAVREACGETAYAAGRFREALAELKAARRLADAPEYLPMMADCERALGRPERALAIARDAAVSRLDEAGRVEMRIVESGARRDLGQPAAAVRVLEGEQLRSRSRAAWVPRLRYAYAEALLADGRPAQAREWFERAAGADALGLTDADERASDLWERLDDGPARLDEGSAPPST